MKTTSTYEENIKRLEEIIRRLEQGDITLEEGLGAFEEGIALVRQCQNQLERVSERLLEITAAGEIREVENTREV